MDHAQDEAEPDHRALLVEMRAFPDELSRAVEARPAESLRRPGSDGGWGAVEALCHLRDWEEIFVGRLRQVIDHDEPSLPAYDDALWEIERDYRGQDPERVLARFADLRGELVAMLESLDEAGWRRVGDHAVHGRVDIGWLAEHLQEHSREHLRQIRDAIG